MSRKGVCIYMDSPELIVVHTHSAGQNVRLPQLPQNGETLRALTWELDRDGAKGTNVAVAASRLRISTALVSRTGTDFWADAADRLLEGCQIDRRFLVRDPGLRTPTGVVFVDQAGNNAIVLGPEEQTIPREQICEALTQMRGAHYCVSGYELDPAAADFALATAQGLGIQTVLNPSPVPRYRPDFSFVSLLIVNRLEAESLLALAGCPSKDMTPASSARKLQQCYGCRQVVITLGAKGHVGMDGPLLFQGEATPVSPRDTSGAGDGFLAATVSCLIRGMCLEHACAWAGKYAALTTQISGTVPSYPLLSEAEEKIAPLSSLSETSAASSPLSPESLP